MKILVTGSAGHLGEALMRSFAKQPDVEYEAIGIDIRPSKYTTLVGSIANREFIANVFTKNKFDVIMHTASLHKPHVITHTKQDFIDTNITGTLNLLEEAVKTGSSVRSFIMTSTTSLYGDAMKPTEGDGTPAAVWITEDVIPLPKNIYGVTKVAAEEICKLMHRLHSLPIIVLRTSRFFPEQDDQEWLRDSMSGDLNLKCNEMLYRRVDIQDIVDAFILAANKAPEIGYDKFIISATTPFVKEDDDCVALGNGKGNEIVSKYYPNYQEVYDKLGWKMFRKFDRVYDNTKARNILGWKPKYDFGYWLDCLEKGIKDPRSPLTFEIGKLGYHYNNGDDNDGTSSPFPAMQEEDRGPTV